MSKFYEIPIIYQTVETRYVLASSLQEAVEQALKEFFTTPKKNYIVDSYEIDSAIREQYGEDFRDSPIRDTTKTP